MNPTINELTVLTVHSLNFIISANVVISLQYNPPHFMHLLNPNPILPPEKYTGALHAIGWVWQGIVSKNHCFSFKYSTTYLIL